VRVPEGRLWDYYDELDRLAEALGDAGRADLGGALAAAKASGCTSGEVLAMTGVVLRKLAQEPLGRELHERASLLMEEGSALWRG
jgi:hypothetical protein